MGSPVTSQRADFQRVEWSRWEEKGGGGRNELRRRTNESLMGI